MKKTCLFKCMTIIMVTFVSVGLISCSKSSDDDYKDDVSIVGTWVGYVDGESVTYQYNADGTGSISSGEISVRFTYSYDKASKYLTINTLGETFVFEILSLTSTSMSGRNVDTGGTMSFTKK